VKRGFSDIFAFSIIKFKNLYIEITNIGGRIVFTQRMTQGHGKGAYG